MVKYTQTICWQFTYKLFECDHFMGLAIKGLKVFFLSINTQIIMMLNFISIPTISLNDMKHKVRPAIKYPEKHSTPIFKVNIKTVIG